MSSSHRDIFLVILLLLFTGLLAILGLQQRRWANDEARGSIYNSETNGASLLAGQIESWGYRVAASGQPFFLSAGDTAFLVLAINEDYSALEAAGLEVWVRNGGTLLIAQDGNVPQLLQQFNLDLNRSWRPIQAASLRLPAFNWPLVPAVTLRARHRVDVSCGQVAIHLGDCRTPLLVARGYGRGQVIMLSAPFL